MTDTSRFMDSDRSIKADSDIFYLDERSIEGSKQVTGSESIDEARLF